MQPTGKVIVVGGPTRNVGKTTLVCALIAGLREYGWTAVKITADDHGQPKPLFEELVPNERKGTGRYLAAGAERAFLLTSTEAGIPLEALRAELRPGTNLIVESNRVLKTLRADVTLALLGHEDGAKPSFAPFVACADAVLAADPFSAALHLPEPMQRFRSTAQEPLPAEALAWVRQRLCS